MGTFVQDVRYGWRMLRRNPGFAAVAIITLALGIGANTAIFAVVNAVLLQPLPYPDSNRLVVLLEGRRGTRGGSTTYPNYRDWQAQNRSFARMGATIGTSLVFAGGEQPELVYGEYVSERLLPTLGVQPLVGRGILPADDRPSATPVALVTYDFWQQHLNGDTHAVGSSLRLDQTSYTVVGVLPQDFQFLYGARPQVFLPLGLLANTPEKQDRAKHEGLLVVARLAPGVTPSQAQSEMDTISARLARAYPNINYEQECNLRSLYEVTVGEVRPVLLILLAAVSLVLLIACANVANLLLARAAARQQEMAIRLSLGAPLSRLFRQLLTESVLLAVCGASVGLLLAPAGVRLLLRTAPEILVRTEEIHINSSVLLFMLLVAVVSGVAFGLAPALQVSRTRQSLQQEGSRQRVSRQGIKDTLVVAELAISLVLLVGAALLVKSFVRLVGVDPGINPRGLVTADIHVPQNAYKTQQQMDAYYDALISNLNGAPGIRSAAMSSPLPFSGEGWGYGFRLEGEPAPGPSDYHRTLLHYVTPEYLQTMQMPLLAGRNFTAQDNDGAPPVALVNQAFVSQVMQKRDPIGTRIRLGGARDLASDANPWFTIVGVVGNVKQYALGDPERSEILVPYDQHQRYHVPITSRSIVIRTEGNASVAVQQLRRVVARLSPNQPITDVVSVEQLISRSMNSDRTVMFLIATFAALALVLAAIGIYGVISYWVAQRTREIGIRMALGAQRSDIQRGVGMQVARLAGAGVALGLPLAFFSSRLLNTMLFGVGAHDPFTFIATPLLLGGVAAAACYVPARRASSVDPMVALRYQ